MIAVPMSFSVIAASPRLRASSPRPGEVAGCRGELIGGDVFVAEGGGGLALRLAEIPGGHARDRLLEVPNGLPVEEMKGFVDGEVELGRLVRGVRVGTVLPRAGRVAEKGLTLVPLRMYFKKGRVKVALALAKGKQAHDKRETIRKREVDRETRAAVKAGRR